MKFIDLETQQSRIKDRLDYAIEGVMAHGQYIDGPEIKRLEDRLANFVGVKHAIACASGTEALLASLMAYEVGPGDLILTTPFTFGAAAEAIALCGAEPVFFDIDPNTFNIDVGQVKWLKDSLPSAKGIIAVNMFGLPCDYIGLREICDREGLFLIEDAAQSFGAVYFGVKSGSLGDIGCTSFFPSKPLGCYGDGGMCFTNKFHLAQQLRMIIRHGVLNGTHNRTGMTGRLDTIQAAILDVKFDIFPEESRKRREVADRYNSMLQVPNCAVSHQTMNKDIVSSHALFSVLAKDSMHRHSLMKRLDAHGVPTRIYYPHPLHLHPAFQSLCYSTGDFPNAEDISERIFSLPMHPYLTNEEQTKVVEVINEAY